MFRIKKDVMHTQVGNSKGCIQIGTIAIFIGKARKNGKQGFYLRLFTPWHLFKLS